MRRFLIEEPYRLYFPLGIFLALGGVGHWLFYALGWTQSYQGFLHSAIQVQLYLTCFVGGFLMTAIPRFSQTRPPSAWEAYGPMLLLAAISVALFFGRWAAAEIGYGIWLLLLLRFIAARFFKRQIDHPPVEFIWIPVAFFLGFLGVLILVLTQLDILPPRWIEMGRSLQEQGFVLSLVLGIGGFLGPRLMGTYVMARVDQRHFRDQLRRKILFHGCGAISLIASFFLEGSTENIKGYALRALTVTAMMLWTRSLTLRPFFSGTLFAKLLSLSFWMIAVGYWLAAIFPKLHVTMLHLVFLGGFSLMIYCVSIMVVLSHGGSGELLRKPLGALWLVGGGTLFSLILRIFATFSPESYFSILGLSAFSWLIAAMIWMVFCVPYCFRQASALSIEEQHRKFAAGESHAC